jgi:hypothetical protein
MTNKELFKAVCKEACNCDPRVGWTCSFCRYLKSKLEKSLEAHYRTTKSPYEPRKTKGVLCSVRRSLPRN